MFLKEFHQGLAVICDDLFFSRYRRSSALSQTLASLPGSIKVEEASRELLESVFGDSHTEADKSNVVEELLDLRLLRGANREGVHFTQEGLIERLTKYSNFSMSSNLRAYLGDVDVKADSARLQGSEEYMQKRLQQLTGQQSQERPVSRYAQGSGDLMTRGMTRQASRTMAVARSATSLPLSGRSQSRQKDGTNDEDLYKVFLEVNISYLILQFHVI